MVLTLEEKGLISRQPGQARSIQALLPRDQLPDLDWAVTYLASLHWNVAIATWRISILRKD